MWKPFGAVPKGRFVLAMFLATQAVYLAMVLLTLPHLRALADGMAPFDMMPTGYDMTYALHFLDTIGAEGRAYYLGRQIPLDLIYPGLFAVSWPLLWLWLFAKAGPAPAALNKIGWLPVLAGIADYAENGLVAIMLNRYPDLSTGLVAMASVMTIAKSLTTALFFIALAVLLIAMGARKLNALRR